MTAPPAANQPAPSPPPRRPWWRLHASTWAVLAVVGVGLVLIVVPASLSSRGFRFERVALKQVTSCRSHGWPWTFCRRTVANSSLFDTAPSDEDGVGWARAENWALTTDVDDSFPLALVGDVLVAMVILSVTAAAFEWRRRRHHRAWQFSLRELLLFTCLVAGVLAWWKCHDIRYRREAALATRLASSFDPFNSMEFNYDGPVWLHRLLGERRTSVFRTAGSAYLNGTDFLVTGHGRRIPKQGMADEQVWDCLNEACQACPKLDNVLVSVKGEIDSQLAPLSRLNRLRFLGVRGRRLTGEAVRDIGELSRLEELFFRCDERPKADLTPLAGLTRLKLLRLICRNLTGRELDSLAELPDLKELEVYGLGDEELEHLHRFKQLRRLVLINPTATPENIARLKQALPNCECDVCRDDFWD